MNCCRWWRFDEHVPIKGVRDRWQQLLVADRPEEAMEVALHRLRVTEVVRWSWPAIAAMPPAPPNRLRNLGPGRFPISMDWQPEAEQQLKEVPFFVRPIVRKRIEKLAAEAGLAAVDTAFYQQSKAKFGQK